jgi:peptidoglycan/xylan/chitin deacetylase (PgdA/CDA1 family)
VLTIVMYHYVRDVDRERLPRLPARSLDELEGQLDYLGRHYAVVTCADVLASRRGGPSLPANACLLTFDDGLADHVHAVAPLLLQRGLTGCFCAPAGAILERRVLDVQKVQLVLGGTADHHALERRALGLLAELRRDQSLPSDAELAGRLRHANRFDAAETVFIKRLLQDGLPVAARRALLDRLFEEIYGHDEAQVAAELYMTLDDLRDLAAAGMDVAGHGLDHVRLELLDDDGIRREIRGSVRLLSLVLGRAAHDWTMCYPYGSNDERSRLALRAAGCALAFTTEVGIAPPDVDLLRLPRLDTNDLPLSRDAPKSSCASTGVTN